MKISLAHPFPWVKSTMIIFLYLLLSFCTSILLCFNILNSLFTFLVVKNSYSCENNPIKTGNYIDGWDRLSWWLKQWKFILKIPKSFVWKRTLRKCLLLTYFSFYMMKQASMIKKKLYEGLSEWGFRFFRTTSLEQLQMWGERVTYVRTSDLRSLILEDRLEKWFSKEIKDKFHEKQKLMTVC